MRLPLVLRFSEEDPLIPGWKCAEKGMFVIEPVLPVFLLERGESASARDVNLCNGCN